MWCLRVTFMATGQVVVQGVVHGLGHGLDEEARRVAQQIRFRPATRDGQAGGLDHHHHHHVSIGVASTLHRTCNEAEFAARRSKQGASG